MVIGCLERGHRFKGAEKCPEKVALVLLTHVALSGYWIGVDQNDGDSCDDGGRAPRKLLLLMQQFTGDKAMSRFSPTNDGWWIPGSRLDLEPVFLRQRRSVIIYPPGATFTSFDPLFEIDNDY